MMSDFKKKNCNHCIYIRPKKDNMCAVLRSKISDVYNLYCDNFKLDIIVERMENALEKKDDEGSRRLLSWLFNFNYSPFKLALA